VDDIDPPKTEEEYKKEKPKYEVHMPIYTILISAKKLSPWNLLELNGDALELSLYTGYTTTTILL
jgi:hypothetical protein